MAEKYLTGAILENGGRLTEQSVALLQKGCGLTDFKLPTGQERFSVVGNPPLMIATERNIGLAEGVAKGKYHWAIVGLDMVADLPEGLQDRVRVIRSLGFGHCQLKLGVSALYFGVQNLAELGQDQQLPNYLEDLPARTRIATRYPNYLNRIMRRRGLNLRVVSDPTPESAPQLRKINAIADISQPEGTFSSNQISEGEVFLESQAVLIVARRLPKGKDRLFYGSFLRRVSRALAHPERWLIA